MKVKYLGHSCFLVKGEKSVCFDPFKNIGYDMEKVSADYCLTSHNHFDHFGIENVAFKSLVKMGDESKIEGLSLTSFLTYHDNAFGTLRGQNSVYKLVIDGFSLCHLGDLGEKNFQNLAEKLGEVDVLFIPIGGKYTIDFNEAIDLINLIKPKIAIPMHFKTLKSNIDIDGIENFLNSVNFPIERVGQTFEIEKSALKNGTVIFLPNYEKF